MKKNTYSTKKRKGVTLIELTVVIAIILVLISVLFVGASYYKTNADKAACIVNISNLHKSMRSVQNISNLAVGSAVTFTGAGTPITTAPTCPTASAVYTLATTVTAVGTSGAVCADTTYGSGGNGTHAPAATAGW